MQGMGQPMRAALGVLGVRGCVVKGCEESWARRRIICWPKARVGGTQGRMLTVECALDCFCGRSMAETVMMLGDWVDCLNVF